jgi:hypothetical protein
MEFLSPSLIEASSYGGHRTRLYYCDPLSPEQKGGIEKNHVELRKVLPKGTSFDSLSQEKLLLAVNHINSYSRVSLNGKTAFDIAACPATGNIVYRLRPAAQINFGFTFIIMAIKKRAVTVTTRFYAGAPGRT